MAICSRDDIRREHPCSDGPDVKSQMVILRSKIQREMTRRVLPKCRRDPCLAGWEVRVKSKEAGSALGKPRVIRMVVRHAPESDHHIRPYTFVACSIGHNVSNATL